MCFPDDKCSMEAPKAKYLLKSMIYSIDFFFKRERVEREKCYPVKPEVRW